MASKTEKVKIKLSLDGEKKVERGMQGVEKSINSVVKSIKFLGAGIGFAAITAGMMKTINAASDVTESMNKVKEVFSSSATSVINFSKTASTSLGTSQQKALEMTGTIGNLLVAMKLSEKDAASMSTRIVQLAADLGSFNNVPTEDALVAIQAALVGEAEPIRRFGADVRQTRLDQLALADGIKFTKGHMDAQTKALMAMKAIFIDTHKAQGDFARTNKDLANATKIAKANIADMAANMGKQLIPAVTSLVNMFNKFTTVKIEDKLRAEQIEFNALVNILKDTNVEQDTRNRAIKKLESQYPDYIGHIKLEKANIEQLTLMQKAANQAFMDKIKLAAAEEKLTEIKKKGTDAAAKLFDAEAKIRKAYGMTAEEAIKAATNENNLTAGIDAHSIKQKELADNIFRYRKEIKNANKEQTDFLNLLKELDVNLNDSTLLGKPKDIENINLNTGSIRQNMQAMIPLKLEIKDKTEKTTLELKKQISLSTTLSNLTARQALSSNIAFNTLMGISNTLVQAAIEGNNLADALERAARALVTKGIMGLIGGIIGNALIPGVGFGAGFKFAFGAQHGMDSTVDRPTLILAGEGNKKEHVRITPQPAPIDNAGKTAIFNFYGDVYDPDSFANLIAQRSKLGFNDIQVKVA